MGRYVERDAQGRITGDFTEPQRKDQEFLEDGHADLVAAALGEARALRRLQVNAELARRNAAGFAHDGVIYQLDDLSQGRIAALAVLAQVNAGADWPDDFEFIAADNAAVPFKGPEFLLFAVAAAQAVIRRRRRARALKDTILAARDAQALAAIDINSGWD